VQNWPIQLFNKSVLKQRKYQEITDLLGDSQGLHCLDIGADNGVISYLLRQRGGSWKSADLDDHTVQAITELVHTDVYQISEYPTVFADNEFDCIILIDFLEHVANDGEFIQDFARILKPDGRLIINVPYSKDDHLRKLRYALGQTDEIHGHLRPGYTLESLQQVLGNRFTLETHHTYSKFFSEFIDTMMVFGISLLKGKKAPASTKGNVVTGQDLKANQSMFKMYSLIYPLVWLFSKLDHLLFTASGYMLIVKARVNK
jgi:2-polyprenyl-3-methyl-5-hydroxy-6-metoxy-1,4-benzoquinol methylase